MKSTTGPLALFSFTILVCIAMASIPISCAGTTNCADPAHALDAACVATNILVQCAGSDVSGIIAQYTPTVEDIIAKGVQADGSINWALIESDLIGAVARYGWCVVAAVFNEYINPPTPAPVGSGSSSTGSGSAVAVAGGTAAKPHPTPQAAKDAFAKLKAKFGMTSAKFQTTNGTVL